MHRTRAAAFAVAIATVLPAQISGKQISGNQNGGNQSGDTPDVSRPRTEPGVAAQRALVAEHDAALRAFRAELTAVTASAEFKKAQEAGDKDAQNALRARIKVVDTEAFAQRALKEAEQFHGDDATPLYCQAVLWG